jgi:hypothetical protein
MNMNGEPDRTSAIEVWARMLCAADAHVYGADHPAWQQLTTVFQDDYRKAAAWLLPRLTITAPPAALVPASAPTDEAERRARRADEAQPAQRNIQCTDAFWVKQPHAPHDWQQRPDARPVYCPGVNGEVQQPETQTCGAWGGCPLPRGHNMGRADIPENHHGVSPALFTGPVWDTYDPEAEERERDIHRDSHIPNRTLNPGAMNPEPERSLRAVNAEALPDWEAVYEPGNVSDYLIGYTNDEAPAKAAAEAWLRSQAEVTGRLEWVTDPQLTTGRYDRWVELVERHDDGIDTGPGIIVRHRAATEEQAETHSCGNREGIDRPLGNAASADRPTVLREAANYVRGVSADRRFDKASVSTALCVVSDELRRRADEAGKQQ